MSACVVDQDSPHKLRCDSKEMSPALPVDRPLLDKLQVRFMNQSRRLKGVVDSLFTHVTSGQLAQVAVHDRDELRGRAIVSARQSRQQQRDFIAFAHLGRRHSTLEKSISGEETVTLMEGVPAIKIGRRRASKSSLDLVDPGRWHRNRTRNS